MRNASSRHIYLLLLALAFIANFSVMYVFWNRDLQDARQTAGLQTRRQLDRFHSSFSFEKVFVGIFHDLFQRSGNEPARSFEDLISVWKSDWQLPAESCEVVFYKGHEPLNCSEGEREEFRFLFSRIACDKFRKYRTEGHDKNRLVKMLNGGVGFERLEAKPGQLRRINISTHRSYAVWFARREVPETRADGMLVLFHNAFVNDRMLAETLFKRLNADRSRFGYLNLNEVRKSCSLPDVDSAALMSGIRERAGASGMVQLTCNGKDLLVRLSPDGHIFYAASPNVAVPLPFWALALFFFWLPVVLNSMLKAEPEFRLSLYTLLAFVVIVSMALPAVAIGFYWNAFISSRRQSLKIEASDRLQQNLIQIDSSFQQTFRQNRKIFRDLVQLLDGRPENLQEFIDRSVKLEIDGMFDACMLINAEGQFVRPYAASTYAVRRMAFYPRAYREKALEQFFAWGWVPFDLEASYALETPTEGLDINEFVSLMPSQGKSAYTGFAGFTAKDLIKMHNSKIDGDSAAVKDGVSSMVMSSLIEGSGENPVARIYQSLGDFFDFGFGANQSINFVDLIKDRDGRATHCLILFSGQYNFSGRFFDKLFTSSDRWPAGVSYLAITDRLFNVNYPWLDMWKRAGRLLAQMQPPRKTHVEEVIINGQPHLLAAYVARRFDGYVLAAALPLSEIEKKLVLLRDKMLFAGLLVAATFLFVIIRIYYGIMVPAGEVMKGVRAFASRNHAYRVSITTNDEWEQLGDTFNSSLESLKELEVAHFVQTCILPASEIAASGVVFAGRTVPADDVGGDYYDAFVGESGEMIFIAGDVSGHSISAALVVSMARAGFAALFDSGVRMPDELFVRFNTLMLEHLRRVKMMTCFAGHIDQNGVLTCSNAGQAFPLIIRGDGSVEFIRLIGYPLGVAKRKAYKAVKMQLPSRCRLVMFSDGVVEAMNDRGEQFGYDRLEALVKSLGLSCSRSEFFAGIYGAVKEFSGTVPWGDDVTVALLDYHKPG